MIQIKYNLTLRI